MIGDKEVWVQIPHEELKELLVSDKGRIKCPKGFRKKGAKRDTYILNQHTDKRDWEKYIIWKRKKYLVKSIVFMAFEIDSVDVYEGKEMFAIRHKNWNKDDNSADNLVALSTVENQALLYFRFKGDIDVYDEDFREQVHKQRYIIAQRKDEFREIKRRIKMYGGWYEYCRHEYANYDDADYMCNPDLYD